MSIWSSFAQIAPLYDGDYGEDELAVDGLRSQIDLAQTGMREDGRLRLWLDVPAEQVDLTIVLRVAQVRALHDELTHWLERWDDYASDRLFGTNFSKSSLPGRAEP